MKQVSRTRNPLMHNGTSQVERLLQALMPDYFRIDDRSAKDLINATFQYAGLLKYYNQQNAAQGDWTSFWKVEMLTFLAHLSTLDLEKIRIDYEEIKETFARETEDSGESSFDSQRQKEYHVQLIEFILGLALRIEETIHYLPSSLPLREEIIALVERDNLTDTEQLAEALKTLAGFHKEAHHRLFEDRLNSTVYQKLFKTYWGIPNKDAFDNQIDPGAAYLERGQEDLDKLFREFHQAFKKIRSRANFYFDRNLDTPQLRQPHVALFLAFLRLFEHARSSLNQLTRKHLEFYYEQVLCLRKRQAVPDDAHLILELAATVDRTLIEKGTAFVGGRDDNGRPLLYKTLENWFLNRTQVKAIKTTYLDVNGVFRDENGDQTKRIMAAPDVKTAYRDGEELPNESNDYWRSMGDHPELPDGEVGFAIASPQLILREGRRLVDVMIKVFQPNPDPNNPPRALDDLNNTEVLNIRLSSEEEWQELSYYPELSFDLNNEDIAPENEPRYNIQFIPAPNSGGSSDGRLYLIQIRILLERDHLPLVALGDDLKKEFGFQTMWPILNVFINPSKEEAIASSEIYTIFRPLRMKEITISVDVKNLQENLIIQSDQGVFDGTQKFYPFGPVPELGDRFYIGSTEVFQKALNELEVIFEWIDPPISFNNYYENYTEIDSGLTIINPALRIDFIDRAEGLETAIPARQNISGEITSGAEVESISGLIKDVGNVGIEGAKITLNNGKDGPKEFFTDSEGKFVIFNTQEYPIDETTTIIFSHTDDLEPVPSLFEDPIELERFTFFEIALYPKRINPSQAFDGFTQLQIIDIFNNELLGDEKVSLAVTNASSVNINYDEELDSFTLMNLPKGISNVNLNIGYFDSGGNNVLGFLEAAIQPPFPMVNIQVLPLEIESIFADDLNNLKIEFKDLYRGKNIVNGLVINVLDNNGDNTNIEITPPDQLDGFYSIKASDLSNAVNLQIQFENNFPLTIPIPSSIEDADFVRVKHFTRSASKEVSITGKVYDFGNSSSPVNPLNDVNIRIIGTDIFTISAENAESGSGFFELDAVPNDLPLTLQVEFEDYSNLVALEVVEGNSIVNITLFPLTINEEEPSEDDSINADNTRVDVEILDSEGNEIGNSIFDASGFQLIDSNGDEVTFAFSDGIFSSEEFEIAEEEEVKNLDIQLTDDNLISKEIKVQKAAFTKITIEIDSPSLQSPITDDTDKNFIEGGIGIFGRGANQVILSDDLKIVVKDLSKIVLDPQPVFNVGENNYRIEGLQPNTFGFIEFSIPNFPKIEIESTKFSTINLVFLPHQVVNTIQGTITDVFNIPLPNVNTEITEIGIKGIPSNTEGEYTIFLPNNLSGEPLNSNLVFSLEDFMKTEVPGNIYDDAAQIDIILYNLLNVFPLVKSDESIRKAFDINISTLSLNRDIRTQAFSRYSPTLKRGFIQLTLQKGDFLHDEYQNVLLKSTLKAAANIEADCRNENGDPVDIVLPNQPYTPATNTIRLNYASSQIITGSENLDVNKRKIDQYFHLYPFKGYDSIPIDENAMSDDSGVCLLPQYDKPTSIEEEKTNLANGNLFIGLQGLNPGANLSLLFQIQEGSEQKPDADTPRIHWAYLAKNNIWKPIPIDNILMDTTNGLKRTGILQMTTPRDMVNETTLFDGNCYWLRAATEDEAEAGRFAAGLPAIVDIRAQAILVQFENNQNELSHLQQPLPAGRISQLQRSQSAVKGIEQPFPSFDGRLPEEGNMFYVRVSERLRHRARALTIYDFERLLLERFPKIQRAKCLNHTRPGSVNIIENTFEPDVELAPGFVTVAVIPELDNRSGEAAAEPRFSKGDLEEMEKFLRTKTNLFLAGKVPDQCREDPEGKNYLRVVNPLYEEVQLRFKVEFKPGEDPQARKIDLDSALKGFLAPWLYDKEFDITFGQPLNRSKIILFVEQQAYVEAIADFEMIHCGENVRANEILPTSSRSILTTVIDQNVDQPDTPDHEIEPVEDICPEPNNS